MPPGDSSGQHDHSVTRMLQNLKANDAQAAEQIWRRFFGKLLPLARARLRGLPDRLIDEEDVILSVFDRFYRAVQDNRFARLQNRDDLWQVLLMLTEHRVTDHYRKAHTLKRGSGQVLPFSDVNRSDELDRHEFVDDQPSPVFVAAFNESVARAFARLTDHAVRQVAILKLEGHENREIADQLQISLSSVERKLRVIREEWDEEFRLPPPESDE